MAVKKLKSILWVLALFPYFLLASGYACNSTLSAYLSYCALGMELFFVIYLTYFLTNIAKFRPWKVETYIAFESEEKSIAFEHYLKSGSGHAFAKRHF